MPTSKPSARLREYLDGLPLARFRQASDLSPSAYLSSLTGTQVSERPWVFCANLGAWAQGTTYMFDLPAAVGDGVAATYDNHEASVVVSGLGTRIDRTLGWTAEVRAAATPSDLALVLAAEVVGALEVEFVVSGDSLNSRPLACVLAHVLSTLSASERDAVQMLIALRYPVEVVAKIATLVTAADALVVNLPRSREVEQVLSDALYQASGRRLKGAEIERLRLSEALMGTPHDEWETKALSLAHAAVEADRASRTLTSGRLYHPLTV